MKEKKAYSIRYLIADTVVEIVAPFRIHSHNYEIFRTVRNADIRVELGRNDTIINKVLYEAEYQVDAWEGIIDANIMIRKIAIALIDFNVFLLHGAAIVVDGACYLFSAPSGTGKTTHILKWIESFPNVSIINGDKPLVKIQDDVPIVYGSPWGGKENMISNRSAPLKAIIMMEQSEENQMNKISFSEAFPALLQQVYRPDNKDKMKKTLRLLEGLKGISFWQFKCNNFKEDCLLVSYNALIKGCA